jgi:hypothetical protein
MPCTWRRLVDTSLKLVPLSPCPDYRRVSVTIESEKGEVFTRVKVEAPKVVQKLPVHSSSEHEEARANHRDRMAVPANGPIAIYGDPSPLSRDCASR